MSSYSLFQEIKNHPWVLVIVIALHLGLAVLLGINLINTVPEASTAKHEKIINAVVINADKFYQREKKKKQALEIKKQQQAQKRKREAEKKKWQLEKKKQLKIKKGKQRKEKLRQQKLKKQKIIKEKARQHKIIAEKQRQQKIRKERERQQKKMAEEKKRAAAKKLKKQKLAAVAKRKAEEKRRAEEKAELEQALQTEEKQRKDEQLRAEQAARLQSLRAQYVKLITQKVNNNWLRLPDSKKGQSCDVVVTQTITGKVIDVRLQSCNADNAFKRSVERAVRKSSPLPVPLAPEIFKREILFTFKPE